jgi:hypothetical protein
VTRRSKRRAIAAHTIPMPSASMLSSTVSRGWIESDLRKPSICVSNRTTTKVAACTASSLIESVEEPIAHTSTVYSSGIPNKKLPAAPLKMARSSAINIDLNLRDLNLCWPGLNRFIFVTMSVLLGRFQRAFREVSKVAKAIVLTVNPQKSTQQQLIVAGCGSL